MRLVSGLIPQQNLYLDIIKSSFYFIEKVILYNDKMEIHCKYTDNPDGTDDHRDFIFYTTNYSVKIDRHIFGGKLKNITYQMQLFI